MSKQRIIDEVKMDCALVPQSLAATNATGPYFPMYLWNKAAFLCNYGPMGTTATVKLEVFQAKDINATGAVLITSASAITNATEVTHVSACKQITLATFIATATITITPYINQVAQTAITYTAHATTTTIASRQFSISGADTADATEFLKCVNDAQYGTPGITWIQAAGVCIGYATDPWTTFTITCSVDNATDVRIVPQGMLLVEVDRSALSWSTGFYWLAAKVTTAVGTIVCGVTLLRKGRYSAPVQQTDIAPVAIGY
jgi:hypothetical protein